MPTFSKPLNSKGKSYVNEFGADELLTDGTLYYCVKFVKIQLITERSIIIYKSTRDHIETRIYTCYQKLSWKSNANVNSCRYIYQTIAVFIILVQGATGRWNPFLDVRKSILGKRFWKIYWSNCFQWFNVQKKLPVCSVSKYSVNTFAIKWRETNPDLYRWNDWRKRKLYCQRNYCN